MISTGSSFRAVDFRDMIKWNEQTAEVLAISSGGAGKDETRVLIDEKRRTFTRNEKKVSSAATSKIFTVLFAPEETQLLKGPPSARRKYVDSIIFQLSQAHRNNILQYEKVLRQRNRVLQDERAPQAERFARLAPWDDQLVSLGAHIISKRHEWCEKINKLLPEQYRAIAPQGGSVRFTYAPHCGAGFVEKGTDKIMQRLFAQIEERRNDEAIRGVTLVGPHRDDIEAEISTCRMRNFASQGEHRSFVLALKMAEMDILKEAAGGEDPILLLDDVASELDSRRNKAFFELLSIARGQIFITATSTADVKLAANEKAAIFEVSAGNVTPL